MTLEDAALFLSISIAYFAIDRFWISFISQLTGKSEDEIIFNKQGESI